MAQSNNTPTEQVSWTMQTKARTVHPSNNNQGGDNMATQNQQN